MSGERATRTTYDPAALERVELRAWLDLWDGAIEDAVEGLGIEWESFGPLHAFLIDRLPAEHRFNLVLGAALPGAVEEGHLEDAVDWLDAHGVAHSIPLTRGLAGTAAAEDWLNRNGYLRRHGALRFLRDASPPRFPRPPQIEVDELHHFAEGFAEMIVEGFGLHPLTGSLFGELPALCEWRCYFSIDPEERAAGAATLFLHEGIARLGWATTAPYARHRGCHLASLERRIADAAAAGCHTLFADLRTGPGEPPSGSACRNLQHAGFRQVCVNEIWETR